MIDGKKVVAFTPAGRIRYMEILWRYVEHEHSLGHIDEWVLFNNAYTPEDAAYTASLPQRGSWIRVIEVPLPSIPGRPITLGVDPRTRQRIIKPAVSTTIGRRGAHHISTFYAHMTETDCIYLRLDDDLVHLDPNAVERLVRYKLANPRAWLVYPTIVNNTRMSYWLQQEGVIPDDWGLLQNVFLEVTAWRSATFAEQLHRLALPWITEGRLSEVFRLRDRVLLNHAEPGVPDQQYAQGHVSINCFVMDGKDMALCRVPPDEEGYLSDFRPKMLNRCNHVCGNAAVVHFAYHPQTTEMEATGLLQEYARLAAKLGA